MKKNELEQRALELKEVLEAIQKTLQSTEEEIKKNDASKQEVVRVLNDISSFATDLLQSTKSMPAQERAEALESSILKILSWSKAEGERVSLRSHVLQERVATLESISGFISNRALSHEARITALERVADPSRDKKHPEKLSIKRSLVHEDTETETKD